jgi:hypothetical protein
MRYCMGFMILEEMQKNGCYEEQQQKKMICTS